MTDLEITKLCAEALGLDKIRIELHTALPDVGTVWYGYGGTYGVGRVYNPLEDDAQAMALVKKCKLVISPYEQGWMVIDEVNENLNRAIVECCARMTKAKQESGS